MSSPAEPATSFLSTEDWAFQVSAVDGDGNPFDLTGYQLRAIFRLQPVGFVIDDCSIENGKIVRAPNDTSVVTLTSYAASRSWKAPFDSTIVWDLMAYRTVNAQALTFGIGRFEFSAIAGVTHD
ncbi:hypothetical protein LMIY3S_03709 [Labrys miyagiensis]